MSLIKNALQAEALRQTPENLLKAHTTNLAQLETKLTASKDKLKMLEKTLKNTQVGSQLHEQLTAELNSIIIDNGSLEAAIDTAKLSLKTAKQQLQKSMKSELSSEFGEFDRDAARAAAIAKIKEWIVKNPNAAHIISGNQFVYIVDESSVTTSSNTVFYTLTSLEMIRIIGRETKTDMRWVLEADIVQAFLDMDRQFVSQQFTVNKNRWNSKHYMPFEHLSEFFIDKFADQIVGDYNPVFDWLMYSLSGGKQENQEHIEQWILHKVINWRSPINTPELVIIGAVGGNGKGILQSIMKKCLLDAVCGQANTKTLNGDFNSILVGKLAVFFDDQNTKEIPLDKVKQLAGNDRMVIEFKGKDQTEVDKCHSSGWFCNVMPFKLEGGQEGGIDRRFSVMRTHVTFDESLAKNLPDLSKEQIANEKPWLIENILLNRVEIAKWFNHLRIKHASTVFLGSVLKPLHGQDYKAILSEQDDIWQTVWDKIIKPNLQKNIAVPYCAVQDIIKSRFDGKLTPNAMTKKFHALASKEGMLLEVKQHTIKFDDGRHTKASYRCSTIFVQGSVDTATTTFDWTQVSTTHFPIDAKNTKVFIEDDQMKF